MGTHRRREQDDTSEVTMPGYTPDPLADPTLAMPAQPASGPSAGGAEPSSPAALDGRASDAAFPADPYAGERYHGPTGGDPLRGGAVDPAADGVAGAMSGARAVAGQTGAAQTGAAQTGAAQTEATQTGAAQTGAAQTGATQRAAYDGAERPVSYGLPSHPVAQPRPGTGGQPAASAYGPGAQLPGAAPGYGAPYDPTGGYPTAPITDGFSVDSPTEHHARPGAGNDRAPRGGALIAACLAFLVVVLGAPALVLAWRSGVGPNPSPSGLVGGLLAMTGLAVLAAGLFPALTAREDAQPGKGIVWTVFRPPVVLILVGTALLIGAAIAV
jgi:hypothetical protein